MNWYEILIIVCAAAFVVGVTAWSVIKRKRGKGGCGCGCADCTHCTQKREENKK